MKDKRVLIGIIAAVVILLGVGGYLVMANRAEEPEEPSSFEDDVITLSPEDIGLEIVPSSNNKQVKFVISKASDIESLEYELSYEADAPVGYEGEEDRISRGVAGEEELESGTEKFESKFLDLGSCSSGTCRFDTGVEEVNLLLKLNKTDGKVYQVEDSLTLE